MARGHGMSADEGKRGVVRDAIAAAADEHNGVGEATRGEALELFPAPTRFSGGRATHLQLALRARNGPGRPAGAPNLGPKEFPHNPLGRGVAPLQRIMEWSMHTPTSLAAELQCSRLEAFDRLKDLWSEVAPFLPQRLPLPAEG